MTLKELSNKFADKNKRISEINEKIEAVSLEIAGLNEQELTGIQNEKPDFVIKLLQKRRDKEDELQILNRVRDSIKTSPVISSDEIIDAWSGISADIIGEFENEVLPELTEAYERFCQAVENVIVLRQKAHEPACRLKRMAEVENVPVRINNPFSNVNLATYYPNRTVLAKLNCLNGLHSDITRPMSFDNLLT